MAHDILQAKLKADLLSQHPELNQPPERYRATETRLIVGKIQAHEFQNLHLFILRVGYRSPTTRMRRQAQSFHARRSYTYDGRVYPRTEYVTTSKRYDVLAWNRSAGTLETIESLPTRRQAQVRMAALVASPVCV